MQACFLTFPEQNRPSRTSGAEYSSVPGVKPLLLLAMPAQEKAFATEVQRPYVHQMLLLGYHYCCHQFCLQFFKFIQLAGWSQWLSAQAALRRHTCMD